MRSISGRICLLQGEAGDTKSRNDESDDENAAVSSAGGGRWMRWSAAVLRSNGIVRALRTAHHLGHVQISALPETRR